MIVSARATLTLLVFGLLGLWMNSTAFAADGAKVEAKEAFTKLKSLAGEWTGEAEKGQPANKIVYRLISNGSVVMETLFPNTDHEMVTMYMLDGDDLRMTHYCAAGNQPRMKLDAKASTPDKLEFIFDGGSNLDPAKDMHMHAGRITFKDKNHIVSEWDAYSGGKKMGSNSFVLSRP